MKNIAAIACLAVAGSWLLLVVDPSDHTTPLALFLVLVGIACVAGAMTWFRKLLRHARGLRSSSGLKVAKHDKVDDGIGLRHRRVDDVEHHPRGVFGDAASNDKR